MLKGRVSVSLVEVEGGRVVQANVNWTKREQLGRQSCCVPRTSVPRSVPVDSVPGPFQTRNRDGGRVRTPTGPPGPRSLFHTEFTDLMISPLAPKSDSVLDCLAD